jgi:hypothetical protein
MPTIDEYFFMVKSTAESIKILADTDLPQVKDALDVNKPLMDGPPSRASMAEFILRGIRGRNEELRELLDMLEEAIWKEYGGKK